MAPPKSGDVVAPAAAPVAKRTTRSTNNEGDDATAPASKRQRKDATAVAVVAADERLDVEAPRKSPSPAAGDAPRMVKKIAKTKDNIRSLIAHGKGKGKAKAEAPDQTESDVDASAAAEAEQAAIDAPKGRGRKPLPTVSSPKLSPTAEPAGDRDVAGDDLADVALESVADKNKENLSMRGKKAAGRPAGKKNFIDAQANAEKVSQIADFEEENDHQIGREAESKVARDVKPAGAADGEGSVGDSDMDNNKPEVISMAGVKRRGKPLTRDVPRAEEAGDEHASARENYNAQMRKEKAARDAEREHEIEREEMRRHKLGQADAGGDYAAGLRHEDAASAAPSPSFSDMKAVAKQKAALHRQQRGTIKPRKPWSAEEEDTFARLIEQHGCNWAQLERTDEMKAFGGRTQSQLKDKAMNMKALIMKAEAPLPKNFQFISLRATQKEDIKSLGIDPDNYPY